MRADGAQQWTHSHRAMYPVDSRTMSFVDQDVLAEASHELKTPLSSIQNSLTLLRLGASGPIPQDALDVLEVVERNTTRMMQLIQEILLAQQATLTFDAIRVDDLIAGAREMVSGDLIMKDVEISYESSELTVLGDESKLVQVMVNLLSNAVKFSPNKTVIRIQAEAQTDRSVVIAVSDSGAGVPESDRERIFLKHEQGDAHRELGSGLGLAIAKRIVEAHGGQIGVRSKSDGKCGATFWIRLKQAHRTTERTMESNAPRTRETNTLRTLHTRESISA